MSKADLLKQISDEILQNEICADLRDQATQLVFGDGSIDAEIVFIGEAPGKKEDETGLPFVGAAGKFLNEMLASIGLERKNVYITNIVKYRPPKNRDPSTDEKQAFLPYLMRQLDVISPKLVVTLGRHSMEYFLPSVKIGDVHGQLQTVDTPERSWMILPLFHPAAALYNGGLRQTLLTDFAKIPRILKQIK
ncbi:uracil-DNA glycosylase [Candidatus Nomurabacteria bacterium]|nr:uracil-DNA glycosylase [Candidatus Nomurabacteria bacterium]